MKFKVGDRVKDFDGDIGTIIAIDNDMFKVKYDNDLLLELYGIEDPIWWEDNAIELIEEKKESHNTNTNKTQQTILKVCSQLSDFLIEKNRAYGNSAFEPLQLFAKNLSPEEQVFVRIDDKLNRLKKGHEYIGDDTIKDLTGYLILLMVMREIKAEENDEDA